MRALRVHQFGLNSLKLEEVPSPQQGSKQIIVSIKAAGVNPVDAYLSSGNFIIKPTLPYTPGNDGAGVVEAIGAEVTRFKVGDRVFLWMSGSGTFAEKAAVDESKAGMLGEALSFEQGAAIGVPYMTAIWAIKYRGQAQRGQTLLIHGASGGVGIAATQLGKKLGLRVIGTAGSAEGLELVKRNGADQVFNHNDQDYVQQIKNNVNGPIDLILEHLLNVNIVKDIELIAKGGKILDVGSRGEATFNPLTIRMKEVSILGVSLFNMPPAESEEAIALVSAGTYDGPEGWVRPVVAKQYALSDGSGGGNDAFRDVVAQPGGAKGKLVIVP